MNADTRTHWNTVYSNKAPEAVSWYQRHADLSLRLIRDTGVAHDASIIDVGAGASTLVDDLLDRDYTNLSVLDVSPNALAVARARLGKARALRVRWIEADITRAALPPDAYDVWHDRAVFHFLTDASEREAYVRAVLRSVRRGGHVIVATFADDGPERCSGLPVMRYRPDALHAQFGDAFTLLAHERESHHTPGGAVQRFVYCYCRKGTR